MSKIHLESGFRNIELQIFEVLLYILLINQFINALNYIFVLYEKSMVNVLNIWSMLLTYNSKLFCYLY